MAQGSEPLGAHGGDVVLPLQRALDQQERLADQGQPVPVEECRAHDHVDEPGLVLEVEEDEALGGAGPLAHHHRSRHLHPRAVTEGGQIRRPRHAHSQEPPPPERHRMRAEGEAGAVVVGDQTLLRGHRPQR